MNEAVSPLFDLPVGPEAHFLRVLETGDDALLARIHAIRTATRSIEVQTFIWANDETGRYMLIELLNAAKRGVVVRLLWDQWVASRVEAITPELVAFVATAHPNLQAKAYNPVVGLGGDDLELAGEALRDLKAVNQRMHNKIMVVDGRIGVTGGRNIENEYYDRGERRNYRDRDILVIGPAVTTMQQSFDEYWSYDGSVSAGALEDVQASIAKGSIPDLVAHELRERGDLFEDLDAAASDPQEVKRRLIDGCHSVRKVSFVADEPGKNPSLGLSGGSRTARALLELIAVAEQRLVVQSPYFVLDDASEHSLNKLLGSRSEVDILVSTNSMGSTDNLMSYALYCKKRRQAMEVLGLRLFELKPVPTDIAQLLPNYPKLRKRVEDKLARGETLHPLDDNKFENDEVHMALHAKTYVVDGRIVWIGSFNIDPRSINLNTEVALIVHDEDVAREVEASIMRDLDPRNSWTVAPRIPLDASGDASQVLESAVGRFLDEGLNAFEYGECFELKPGEKPVSCFDSDFHRHYVPVGLYPGVSKPIDDLEISATQLLASLAEPLV